MIFDEPESYVDFKGHWNGSSLSLWSAKESSELFLSRDSNGQIRFFVFIYMEKRT